MQLFVRTLRGETTTVSVDSCATVADLKRQLEARGGLPARHQCLLHGGRLLGDDAAGLAASGLERDATVHQTARLRGGKPVKVKIITNHLPCGQEVTIDLEPAAGKDEIKRKLERATGVPAAHQKIMLSGINQIVMGDKRTNIAFASCGYTNSVEVAVNSKSK